MKILVTSALPYANGDIHLGHLAGCYLPADIYVRYQKLLLVSYRRSPIADLLQMAPAVETMFLSMT